MLHSIMGIGGDDIVAKLSKEESDFLRLIINPNGFMLSVNAAQCRKRAFCSQPPSPLVSLCVKWALFSGFVMLSHSFNFSLERVCLEIE